MSSMTKTPTVQTEQPSGERGTKTESNRALWWKYELEEHKRYKAKRQQKREELSLSSFSPALALSLSRCFETCTTILAN